MRDVLLLSLGSALLVGVALLGGSGLARADWRDPIGGGSTILPAQFETGEAVLTVHAAPLRPSSAPDDDLAPSRWSQPLVDRHLQAGERTAPLAPWLLEAITRIEPIYDPTLLDGPGDAAPMHVSAGTAESRDLFADHWRVASPDANVDADIHPLASVWQPAPVPRPCSAYRVRRRHDWGEAALSALTVSECRLLHARQASGFAEAAPIPVAIAAPPIPVFAAPEPGSRMSSADFWAAQRARIAGIHAHLHRKWVARARQDAATLRSASR